MEKLRLMHDEPDIESELFQFKVFASQLESFLLDPKTPSPYTIGLHGDWGSGKTSLIRRVFEQIEEKNTASNWKTVWFDAWQYERTDPVLALMQRIALRYSGSDKQKFKQIVTGLLLLFSDIALRAYTSLDIKEVQKHFESTVKTIPTITENLQRMVGDGRLIIFIDDLDRCIIENALGILEAIKLFLNAKGVIFVIAVDISKLEKAWELRYHGSTIGLQEGRDHIEKIFQLKLSLPPKEEVDIKSYVTKMTSSLPDNIRNLIIKGCPPNPRKIKRVVNLIYFLASKIGDSQFNEYLPAIIIWSIATIIYPSLSQRIKSSPKSLVQMSLIAHHMQDVDTLESRLDEFRKVIPNRTAVSISKTSDLPINYEHLLLSTVKGLEYVVNNTHAFDFLKSIAQHYSIIVNNEVRDNVISTLEKHYDGIGKLIGKTIYEAGLVG